METNWVFPLSQEQDPFLFDTVLQVLAVSTRQEKDIKVIKNRKGRIQLSLFPLLKDPIESTRKLLNLINAVKLQVPVIVW